MKMTLSLRWMSLVAGLALAGVLLPVFGNAPTAPATPAATAPTDANAWTMITKPGETLPSDDSVAKDFR